MAKGTYEIVTEIMEELGFNTEKAGELKGLERAIREALTQAYIEGYSAGKGSD